MSLFTSRRPAVLQVFRTKTVGCIAVLPYKMLAIQVRSFSSDIRLERSLQNYRPIEVSFIVDNTISPGTIVVDGADQLARRSLS
jgi:hypothetical protein